MMRPEALDQLLESYADGTLDADQDRRLADLITANDDVAEEVAMIGLLRQALEDNDEDAIARSFSVRLRAEDEGSQIVKQFEIRRNLKQPARTKRSRRRRRHHRPARSSAWMPWLGVAAAVAFALLIFWFASTHSGRPGASYATVRMQSAEGQRVFDAAIGSVVETNDAASATIVFADKTARLQLQSDSAVQLNALAAGGKLIELRHGTVTVTASKHPADRPLEVSTVLARIRTVGTRFTVSHDSSTTGCRVMEGQVRIEAKTGSETVEIGAGQGVDITASGAIRPHDGWASINVVWQAEEAKGGTYAEVREDTIVIGARSVPGESPSGIGVEVTEMLPSEQPLRVSGVFERGPVKTTPYIEFTPNGVGPGNIRLRFHDNAVSLEARARRVGFTKLERHELANPARCSFRMELHGDRVRCLIDDQVIYDGEHGMPMQPRTALWINTSSLDGTGMAVTFHSLSVESRISP